MIDINTIFDLLDWNNDQAKQKKGIELGEQIRDISILFQPCTHKYNKNIWDNCAIIISSRTDEELIPFLPKMLEWLQDLNWPGAKLIYERLLSFSDAELLYSAINLSIKHAESSGDDIWLINLNSIFPRR